MTDNDRQGDLENQFAQWNQELDIQFAEFQQPQLINTNSIVSLNQVAQGLIDIVRINREITRQDRERARETTRRIEVDMREM